MTKKRQRSSRRTVQPQPAGPIASRLEGPVGLVAVLVLFLLVVALYFYPVWEGDRLDQHDIVQFRGMSKAVTDYRQSTGEEALWNPNLFSGMPAYQSGAGYPGNLFVRVNKVLSLGLPHPVGLMLISLVGFFLLCLSLQVSPLPAGLGALAFGFSSYIPIILQAGHNSKFAAMAYMAPVLTGVLLALNGRRYAGATVLAFTLALQLASNHFQISYYLALLVGVVLLAYGIQAVRTGAISSFTKASGLLVLAALFAVGPNLSRLWTTYEYMQESIRGTAGVMDEEGAESAGLDRDYALSWSYGLGETMTVLVPNLFGGASTTELDEGSASYRLWRERYGEQTAAQITRSYPTYWGDQPFTEGPVYLGAVVCLLFVLGLFLVRGPMKWWIVTVTVMAVALSWGRHLPLLTDLFLDYFPFYNKFRAVSMTLVLAQLTVPLLAVLGLRELSRMTREGNLGSSLRPVLWSVAVVGGLALLVAVLGPSVFGLEHVNDGRFFASVFQVSPDAPELEPFKAALHADRGAMLRSDALRSLLFVVLAGGVLFAWVLSRVRPWAAASLLTLLVLVDLWGVDRRYLGADQFVSARAYESQIQPSPAERGILDAQPDGPTHFRVVDLHGGNLGATFADAETSAFVRSLGGYHGAKLRRYQDLIEGPLGNELQRIVGVLRNPVGASHLDSALAGSTVLNMLDTRYLIVDDDAEPLANRHAFGPAWLVDRVQVVSDRREAYSALSTADLASVALVESSQAAALAGLEPAPDSTAQIRLTAFAPDRLTYESRTESPQVAVFSEVFYDDGLGWTAYLDGSPVSHLRANYLLRALPLPAGTHEIEFRFAPRSYYLGERISLALSILILALGIGALGFAVAGRVRQGKGLFGRSAS